MRTNHRASLAIGVVAATVVVMAACEGRPIIGHQTGSGGAAGTAGIGENVSGEAGTSGIAGTVGSAGIFGSAGVPGSAGIVGSAGVPGSAGAGYDCSSTVDEAGLAFLPPVLYPLNRYSQSVALGDLNGDGRPDLVVINEFAVDQSGMSGSAGRPFSDQGSVSVFLSEGGAAYAPALQYLVGNRPTSAAVGDLNGDGKADVAVSGGGSVTVLLNDGAGALSAPVTYASGTDSLSVAIADLNGDGKNDVAVANRGQSPIAGDVAVLLNIGNRMFTATSYPAGSGPVHVAIGDLNGDGKPDLAVSSGPSVNVLTNEANRFGPPASYGAGTNPSNAVIGDLNGDGRPDLVVGGWGGAGVLLNIGNGAFAAAVVYPAAGGAIGDVNVDGKPDMVGLTGYPCGAVTFRLNAGDGTFGVLTTLGVNGHEIRSVTVGDLNADGKPDVVVPSIEGVTVLLNAAP